MAVDTIDTNPVDLSSEVIACPGEPVAGERAWIAGDIAAADWLVKLDDEAMRELADMVALMRLQPLPVILRTPETFNIPHLAASLARVKSILDDGCGFAVLDALPIDDQNIDEMVGCFWILGQMIGRPVAQKWDGTMIYDVTDTGRKYSYGVRGSTTNVELVFHTDNAFGMQVPDYVGLLCKYPALEGGVSRFCSLNTLHNRLLADCPELLARLYEPMHFDRQAEHAPGAPKTSRAPFFSLRNGRLTARANISLVRKGYEVAGEDMDAQLTAALAAVHDISGSAELWYEAPLARGQVQYLNNHELGHYRSEFSDTPNSGQKRHLFRTWHREAGGRTYDG